MHIMFIIEAIFEVQLKELNNHISAMSTDSKAGAQIQYIKEKK